MPALYRGYLMRDMWAVWAAWVFCETGTGWKHGAPSEGDLYTYGMVQQGIRL